MPTQLFINNEFVDAKSGTTFKTINPATEEVIAEVQAAGKEDIDDAVRAASEAFKTWKKSNGCDRRDLLLKLADLVEKHRDQLSALESLDNGKPEHVANGVDVNEGDYDSRRALHLAASEGRIEVVKFLVGEAGADPSPVDRWGNTPQIGRASCRERV